MSTQSPFSDPKLAPPTRRDSRPSAATGLNAWWRNRPIGVKLRVSLLIVLLLAFGVIIGVTQNVQTTLALQNLEHVQSAQAASIAQNIQRILLTDNNIAAYISNQEITSGTITDYLDSLGPNFTAGDQTPIMQSQLAADLNLQMTARINVDSVRFDLPTGKQGVRINRDPISNLLMSAADAQLGDDHALPGFANLANLSNGQPYLITVQSQPTPVGRGANGLTFQIGVPVILDGQLKGVFIVTFPNASVISDFFGKPINGVTYALMDDGAGDFLINTAPGSQSVMAGNVSMSASMPMPGGVDMTNTMMSASDRASALASSTGSITYEADQQVITHVLIPISMASGQNYWHVIVTQVPDLQGAAPVSALLPFLIIFVILILATLLIERVVTSPLRSLASATRLIRDGDFTTRVSDVGQDEIGQLGQALNTMSEQVSSLLSQMESRVIERTRDVEVVAEISRDVAATRDIDLLLANVVEQLRERFGFYHVQIFLTDNAGEYAVLRSSTGSAGRTLLERQHRLLIGSESIVGQATVTGHATITQDTDRSRVAHFRNPLLPETRSEMALPIRAGRSVLGALDVQSRYENAFDEDDIRIFQVLADQLAITIQNARLIESNQYETQRAQTLLNEATTNSWRDYLDQQRDKPLAYRYDTMNVRAIDPTNDSSLKKPTPTGRLKSLQAPISVRGVPIGDLSATSGEGELLTADDRLLVEAVADRVALAIENVRLNQQSRIAFGEVERLYELNRSLSSAPTVSAIYRLVAEQLEQETQVDRLNILAADPIADRSPQGFTYMLRWDRFRKVTTTLDATPGNRVPLRELGFLDINQPTKPWQIDLTTPFNPLLTTQVIGQAQGVQSMVVAPITIAGRWFGLLVVQSRQPHAFNDRFLQFLTALSDQTAVALENRYLFDQTETGRATLQSVLEALPVAVFVIEAASRKIVLFNSQALDFLGQSQTRATLELNDVRTYIPAIDTALSTGIGEVLTYEPPEDVPVARTMRLETSAVKDTSGKLISLIIVISDITDLQTAQNAVEDELITASEISEFEKMIAGQADLESLLTVIGQQMQRLQQPDIVYFVWQTEGKGVTEAYSLQIGGKAQVIPLGPDHKLPFPVESLNERAPQNLYNVALTNPKIRVARLSSFPLRSRARITGWLIVGTQEINPTVENDRLFQTTLDRLAILAEALRLQRQTEIALRETERLYLASRAISSSLSSEETATALREQLRSLEPDRIDIFLLNAHTDEEVRWVESWTVEGTPITTAIDMALTYPIDFLSLPMMTLADVKQANPEEQDMIAEIPGLVDYRSIIHYPIQVKNLTVGRLIVGFSTARNFSTEDLRFIETLCEQAATVVDNALLYQESQQALEETSTLYQAGRAIVNAEEDSQILPAIADYVFPPIITHAMLFRFLGSADHAAEGTLLVVSDWVRDTAVMSMSGMVFTPDQFMMYNLLSTPDLHYVEDVENSDTIDEDTRQICLSLGLKALVVVPLTVAGRAVGALLIGSDAHYVYTSRELRMYSSLADQAAVTLDNRSLLRQTEARARQIQTSSEVGRATTSILNLSELLQQTVYLIQNSFGYDHVQIFLVSPDGKDARLQASTGEAGRQLLEIKHALAVGSSSVIGRVTASGQLYNVMDTHDPNSTHKPNPYLANTRSELALPLTARGHVIGALDVQSNAPRAFAPDDEQILGTLSDQLAVAIDNASLFGQNEQRINEVRFLFNATRAAMNAETDIAFSRVTRQILENTPSDLVVLFTPEAIASRWHLTYAAREGIRYVLPSGLPANFGLLGELARTRQPIIRDDHGVGKLFSADDVPDVRALAIIPLSTGDDLLGALAVFSTQADVYNPDLIQLLQTLVSSLAAIVQNAQLFRDLQDANVRLKEVDQIKSQFLANMSHELRTPLNSIIGFSRVILKGLDGPLNEVQSQDLNTVYESGRHLLNLVNAILDQAKIEAGKMEVDQKFFDVNTSIKTAMSTVVGLVKDKPIRLHQEIQADLPEVFGDETRVTQILLNMLSNAAKFTRQGSITLSAFTATDEGRPMVQISVTDTGIGIPPESLERVFAAFEQVDNSVTRGAEGTGLGMPIARSLIEMMGGRIWVESTINVGSTFSIVLPTEAIEQAAPAEVAPVENTEAPESISAELAEQVEQALSEAKNPDFEHRIIIALDDEPGMFNLFRRYLTKSGYEVIGTTKPEELIELVITYQPRAVLLDINMPNYSGWDILQMLKNRPETFDYPVIMCSIEDDKVRGHRLGASGYLVKPFLEEDLYDVLKRIELERGWPLVLLIDDQPESLRLMRDSLVVPDLDIRILEAADGDQGLAMIASQHPTVVIMDVRMPDPDGFAMIEKLRSDPATADLPVLLITASELTEAERSKLRTERVEYKGQLSGDDLVRYIREQVTRG